MDTVAEKRREQKAATVRSHLLTVVQTRTGLQQGFLLMEILAPPLAKRRSHPSPPGGSPGRRVLSLWLCVGVTIMLL
jgi:hypothetical protein